MAVTEMQADLQRTQMEQDAAVEIEKIRAAATVKKARLELKEARWRGWPWDGFLFFLGAVLIVGGSICFGIYQHINYTNQYAERVAACEQAGGTWAPQYTTVKNSDNKEWTDVAYVCKRGVVTAVR